MRKNKYNINLLLIAFTVLALLQSCSDFFVQELEIPRQDLDQQIVVHSFISDIDSSIHFKIGKNFTLNEDQTTLDNHISGAEIVIFGEGEKQFEVKEEDQEYYVNLDEEFGDKWSDFRVEIKHPQYETAIIESEMPKMVLPDSVIYREDAGFGSSNNDDNFNAIDIVFQDPPGEENYYEISVQELLVEYGETIVAGDTFRFEKRYPTQYFIQDINIIRGVSGFLLSDELFDGQEYRLNMILSTYLEQEDIPVDRIKVVWRCISKDHFEFSKSLEQYKSSSDFGLFSDPIAVYSNVENGLGIVSFNSLRMLPVEQ